jgi:proteasome assembly chaperone (PAC2) family protein
LDKPYFNFITKPKIIRPTTVIGLPGPGNVGRIVANLLIRHTKAEKYAEFYAPYFPDQVFMNETGICSLPHWDMYSATKSIPNFIIVTGASLLADSEPTGYYDVCTDLLRYIKNVKCKRIFVVDGISANPNLGKIFFITSKRQLVSFLKNFGIENLGKGKLSGLSGLFLGYAEIYGIEGIGLIGSTVEYTSDQTMGISIFRLLTKIENIKIKTTSPGL